MTPLAIGPLRIDFPVFLAPMAGYTDAAMRGLSHEFGCGVALTEVTNAVGLARGSIQTLHLLETAPGERPVGAHLYGADPDILARAAEQVYRLNRFDFIDLNCGCPVRKIVAKGSGAALMNDPARVEKLVRAMAAASPLPVTLKTRIGLEPNDGRMEHILEAAQAGGVSAVFLHARYACNQHRGPAHWDRLVAARALCRVPLVGNGGILAPADVFRMIRETGVDGVMIGRAAVGCPWIFRDIRALDAGQTPQPHRLDEHRRTLVDHLERLWQLKRLEPRYRTRQPVFVERAAVLHFRAHLYRYLSGFRNWARLRCELNDLTTVAGMMELVDRVLAFQRSPYAPSTGGLVPVEHLPEPGDKPE